jgi:hypothetical protein
VVRRGRFRGAPVGRRDFLQRVQDEAACKRIRTRAAGSGCRTVIESSVRRQTGVRREKTDGGSSVSGSPGGLAHASARGGTRHGHNTDASRGAGIGDSRRRRSHPRSHGDVVHR